MTTYDLNGRRKCRYEMPLTLNGRGNAIESSSLSLVCLSSRIAKCLAVFLWCGCSKCNFSISCSSKIWPSRIKAVPPWSCLHLTTLVCLSVCLPWHYLDSSAAGRKHPSSWVGFWETHLAAAWRNQRRLQGHTDCYFAVSKCHGNEQVIMMRPLSSLLSSLLFLLFSFFISQSGIIIFA
jgi:hypothetical protein